MTRDTGQMGATQLLAQLLASIHDPDDGGIGVGIDSVENGVAAEVHMPAGDRYLVVVQWQGDNE